MEDQARTQLQATRRRRQSDWSRRGGAGGGPEPTDIAGGPGPITDSDSRGLDQYYLPGRVTRLLRQECGEGRWTVMARLGRRQW